MTSRDFKRNLLAK